MELTPHQRLIRAIFGEQSLSPEDTPEQITEEVTSMIEKSLLPKERKIIEMYFGIGHEFAHTLEEIGEAMNGLSKERIRQIKEKAIQSMRSGKDINKMTSKRK